jgi:membrane-associated phospholipid phosphatase
MSTPSIAVSRARASVARVISDVFSPPVLAVPGLLLGAYFSSTPGVYSYALSYFLVGVLAPVMYVVWLLRIGAITDFHIPERRDRRGPFLASLGSGLIGVGLLMYLGAPATFIAPVVTLLAETLILFFITLFWQVSIHTATTAGLVTFAVYVLGSEAFLLTLLVPLVAWARVYLERHTVTQTIWGALIGLACFLVLIALRGIVW